MAVLNGKDTMYQPPSDKELESKYGKSFRNVWRFLVETEQVSRVAQGIFFSSDVLNRLKDLVKEHIEKEGSIDVKTLRTILDTSRKYSIAILEHFDQTGFTRREGDLRVLNT